MLVFSSLLSLKRILTKLPQLRMMMTMEFVAFKVWCRRGELERVKGYDIPLSFEILSEIHDADQVGQD